jgi:Holliday junction DNA helicase RuvA
LFGFTSEGEKRVFITLLGVTGIGPRVALNIVSGIGYEELMRAIDAEDIGRLTKVPGLGKKTASRLVLELRGKLPKGEGRPADPILADALSALVNFGYRKSEAEACLDAARKRGVEGLETLIKEALKCLTGARGEAG